MAAYTDPLLRSNVPLVYGVEFADGSKYWLQPNHLHASQNLRDSFIRTSMQICAKLGQLTDVQAQMKIFDENTHVELTNRKQAQRGVTLLDLGNNMLLKISQRGRLQCDKRGDSSGDDDAVWGLVQRGIVVPFVNIVPDLMVIMKRVSMDLSGALDRRLLNTHAAKMYAVKEMLRLCLELAKEGYSYADFKLPNIGYDQDNQTGRVKLCFIDVDSIVAVGKPMLGLPCAATPLFAHGNNDLYSSTHTMAWAAIASCFHLFTNTLEDEFTFNPFSTGYQFESSAYAGDGLATVVPLGRAPIQIKWPQGVQMNVKSLKMHICSLSTPRIPPDEQTLKRQGSAQPLADNTPVNYNDVFDLLVDKFQRPSNLDWALQLADGYVANGRGEGMQLAKGMMGVLLRCFPPGTLRTDASAKKGCVDFFGVSRGLALRDGDAARVVAFLMAHCYWSLDIPRVQNHGLALTSSLRNVFRDSLLLIPGQRIDIDGHLGAKLQQGVDGIMMGKTGADAAQSSLLGWLFQTMWLFEQLAGMPTFAMVQNDWVVFDGIEWTVHVTGQAPIVYRSRSLISQKIFERASAEATYTATTFTDARYSAALYQNPHRIVVMKEIL